MSDLIEKLQTDEFAVDPIEFALFNQIIPPPSPKITTHSQERLRIGDIIAKDVKENIFIGIVFFMLSLPSVDELIMSKIPYASSGYVSLICTKTLIFIVLLILIRNRAYMFKN